MNTNANYLGSLLYLSVGAFYIGVHNPGTLLSFLLHVIGTFCLIMFFEILPKYIRGIKTKCL